MREAALGLEAVALHLRGQAEKHDDVVNEAFARSVYNRYYYASFLYVRDALSKMKVRKETDELLHKDIPDILYKIGAFFQNEGEKVDKNGFIDIDLMNAALFATLELAKTMAKAKDLRNIADYEPYIKLKFNNKDTFSLNYISALQICQWHENVVFFTGIILKAWMHLDDKPN